MRCGSLHSNRISSNSGFACPYHGMTAPTQRCSPGHYCPPGSRSSTQVLSFCFVCLFLRLWLSHSSLVLLEPSLMHSIPLARPIAYHARRAMRVHSAQEGAQNYPRSVWQATTAPKEPLHQISSIVHQEHILILPLSLEQQSAQLARPV